MIYITGDTHCHLDVFKIKKLKKADILTYNDVIIVAGDFGLLWNGVPSEKELEMKELYHSLPCSVCFVDGNHENFDRIKALPTGTIFGNTVGMVSDKIFHLQRGRVYNIRGKKVFTFGGGFSVDKYRRALGVSWWEEEMPSQEEYIRGLKELEENDNKVDIIITHTCSNRIFKKLLLTLQLHEKDVSGEAQLRRYFDIIEEEAKFDSWFFGHFHDDIDIDKKFFLLYNRIVDEVGNGLQ